MPKQPTFVTLTKLQNREPTLLRTVIDNTCGKLNAALRSFHYEVGSHTRDDINPTYNPNLIMSFLHCMEGCIP